MIRIGNLQFHEDEQITLDTILRCHPQGNEEEALGIPLRVTLGYQCIYDKAHRNYQGITFYAPVSYSRIRSENKLVPNGAPIKNLSYVLASFDGKLVKYKDGVCLIDGDKTLIYTNLDIIKSSGSVKKGAIIGTVKEVDNAFAYGVIVRGYKGGKIWNIPNDLMNIPCIE